jgi:replicative DNA helicase
MRRKHHIQLLIIDHINLVVGSKDSRRYGDTAIVTETTAALKALAKELEIPVLALSQLNRGLEGRDDKRPTLADLRQSGSIEQDADVVLFLYRDEYYLQRENPQRRSNQTAEAYSQVVVDHYERLEASCGIAEIIVAKNRNGPNRTVRVHFDAPRCLFSSLELRHE